MNDHCWAFGNICSLLPQTPFPEFGALTPRMQTCSGRLLASPTALSCLYAICPWGLSLAGSELAASLWPCVVTEKVLETYCWIAGHISATWKQVGLYKSHCGGKERSLGGRSWCQCSRLGQRDCCLLFGILDRQPHADRLASTGPLGACIRQKATDSAEKFADSKKMHCCAAHCCHGGGQASSHLDTLM